MTPMERLLAEELPTGSFGGPRPDAVRTARTPRIPATPRVDADRHYAELAAAIGESPLRPVPDTASAAA